MNMKGTNGFLRPLVALAMAATLTAASTASAADCSNGTCVPPEDMKVFVQLLKDQQCRNQTPPTFHLDPVTIVIDKDGRVYGSGDDPQPYRLHMSWCNYEVDGKGSVHVLAARKVEPDWGFRFRPKFTTAILPIEAKQQDTWSKGLDAGLLVDFFYWKALNLNAHVGFRSIGLGVGVDITRNFGAWVGYANTWDGWRSNVIAGLYFGF
jgi:hypothetical protein